MKIKRPFFSLVIPCYNPGKYIRTLLNSVVTQGLKYGEIEVIISDDHSTEPYQDIIDEYKDKLLIKQIETDYNFGPGNTREKGTTIATGEWLCFADQDDMFAYNIFKDVKKFIKKNKEAKIISYAFVCSLPVPEPTDYDIISYLDPSMSWLHGKFYNMDKLWKMYNIHFKKDLFAHEDTYVNSLINCVVPGSWREGVEYFHIKDRIAYYWLDYKESLSRSTDYLSERFADYFEASVYVHYDCFKEGNLPGDLALGTIIDDLLHAYFYIQSMKFRDSEFVDQNERESAKVLYLIENSFDYPFEKIIEFIEEDNCKAYYDALKHAILGAGGCIPQDTLYQWLKRLQKLIDEEGVKYERD